jgi:hypothetical protein
MIIRFFDWLLRYELPDIEEVCDGEASGDM